MSLALMSDGQSQAHRMPGGSGSDIRKPDIWHYTCAGLSNVGAMEISNAIFAFARPPPPLADCTPPPLPQQRFVLHVRARNLLFLYPSLSLSLALSLSISAGLSNVGAMEISNGIFAARKRHPLVK